MDYEQLTIGLGFVALGEIGKNAVFQHTQSKYAPTKEIKSGCGQDTYEEALEGWGDGYANGDGFGDGEDIGSSVISAPSLIEECQRYGNIGEIKERIARGCPHIG